ncbi:hypothetical protein GCM10010995_21500 [Cysteiniphilum litorale]|uniref:Uncharacterized protein n=1 Tax=Cysteiniphilum litorale TaxID=2056700 RepID=A0A8J2Z5U4_9GAMM|nr:hypothetical protein GCM10010995_21500 [Cysteiniphilum litorale]
MYQNCYSVEAVNAVKWIMGSIEYKKLELMEYGFAGYRYTCSLLGLESKDK